MQITPQLKSVLIVSHGSRLAKTKEEVLLLIGKLKVLHAADIIEFAFLELESPSILEGIELCVKQGASSVLIALNFLNAGLHVDDDIPTIVAESARKNPSIRFTITKPIGQHEQIPNLFLDLINRS